MRLRPNLAGKRSLSSLALWVLIVLFPGHVIIAQELAPRAYVITPVGSNAITLSSSFFKGDLDLNGAVPVEDARGTFSVSVITYYRSFNFFGRSANLGVGLPYGVGTFQGSLTGGGERQAYRSGLMDSGVRFAVNLMGGPAMPLSKFMGWKQKTLLGASLRVIVPTGQYDPSKLINWGINRWALKPEFGVSRRWGKWLVDGYGGAWFFTTNPQSFSLPKPKPQSLSPIVSCEGHLSYDVKPRLWFSLDGNFWTGGTATVEGVPKPDTKQTSARIGGTASIPLNKHQSIKVSYSRGAYARFGGNYQNLSFAWQYGWIGKPQ